MKNYTTYKAEKLSKGINFSENTLGVHKEKDKNFLNKWFLTLSFIVFAFSFSFSQQQFPVQVNQAFVPPYDSKLNNYATSTSIKMRLFLTLTDININNRQVRLKLKIEGQGISAISRDFVTGANAIFLTGGTQEQFTNINLSPYFLKENLIGINTQQYNQSLPEGSYRFCWEVYDYLTNQLISNPNLGCTSIYITLNDPPFLNLPQDRDQLVKTEPTNIIFQWTPRHTNAINVSYDFELRELWDTAIDPQVAFFASPNFHQENTYSTTLLYNISKPTLLPGKTYAWRIRAKSLTGLDENAVFDNDGFSEVYYFTYTNSCDAPTFLLAEPKGTGQVKINWQINADHNRYHIQYKRADVDDGEWFEVYSFNNQVQVANLQEGVTYDFRVGGTCDEITSPTQAFSYTGVNQFTMPSADESVTYSCGIVPEIEEITNQELLTNIGMNESFTAGDFPVTVKQIQFNNGVFSGVGYIVVPYLADTKIAVEFEGIKINTDYQLIDGIIKTSYDPTWGGMSDVGDMMNGSATQANTNTVSFPIAEVVIDPNGDILIVGEGGSPIVELPGGEDYTIVYPGDPGADPAIPSQTWHVDENGNVTEGEEQAEGGASTAENTNGVNSNGEANDITSKGVTVTFTKAANTIYGFDAYDNSYSKTESLYKKLGENYYIPYKGVAKEKDAFITANVSITNDTIKPHHIVFKTVDGTALTKIDSTANSYTLKLTGVFDDAAIETQAVIKQGDKYEVAGVFIQYQLTEKEVDIILVNTTGENISSLKSELTKIYQQAMVNLTITEVNDFTNDLNSIVTDGTIDSGESGFAAQYTEEQRAINSKLRRRPDYKESAYYLLLTNKKPSTSGEKGLMPLGRQFGYIYETTVKTVAHEIGHGVFELKHPFSSSSHGWAKNSTNWLLDYPENAIHIPYEQWKSIHNPTLRIGIFDSDEEGEFASYEYYVSKAVVSGLFVDKLINYTGNTVSFITSANKLITLPNTVKDVTFHKGGEGTLFAFTLDKEGEEVRYVSAVRYIGKENENFAGFLSDLTTKTKEDWKKAVYKDIYSMKSSFPKTDVEVYLGELERGSEKDDPCGINLYKTTVDNNTSGSWNSGGNEEETNYVKLITSNSIKLNDELIECSAGCDICITGGNYYNKFLYLAKDEKSRRSLMDVAFLICDDTKKYSSFLAQIEKDFSKKVDDIFWYSDKAEYESARNAFWEREDAFGLYYEALVDIKARVEYYSSNLDITVPEEDLNAALYYLNDNYIKSLSLSKKKELLKAIFKNNYFINDDFFDEGNSDISFIKKIVRTIDISDLNDILLNLSKLEGENEFTGSKKEVILEICNAIEPEDLKKLNLDVKVVAIQRMLKWTMASVAGSNYYDIIIKVFESVKDEEASTFLNKLETVKSENAFKKPLVYSLKEKLSNFFSNGDAYTGFFKQLIRLTEARSKISPNEYKMVAGLPYNVANDDYVLISFVRDKNNYRYEYNNTTHKVNILTCKNGNENIVACTEEVNIVEEASPFDVVMLYFIDGASPFKPIPNVPFHSERREISAKGYLVPVLFLEHLQNEQGNQRIKNFAWNTFNVVLTVATLGEGAVAITAVRVAASSGTKILVRTILKNSFSLLDFGYTIGKTGYQFSTSSPLPSEFQWVDNFLMAKGAYDLVNGGLKGLASLQDASPRMRKKIISELEIKKKNGYIISDSEFDDLIAKSIKKLESPTIDKRLQIAWEDALKFDPRHAFGSLLLKVDGFKEINPDFKKWIVSLNKESDLIQNLDEFKKIDLENFAKDFDFTKATVASKFTSNPDLAKAWDVLRESPTFSGKEANLEILANISKRFQYNNEQSFKGLNKLLNEGSKVASKQKLLDGLQEANKLFDNKLPIEFSAIKKGEVTVNVTSPNDAIKIVDQYGRGEEVGRYVDGILQKKKIIADGDGVKVVKKGDTPADDILQNGDDIGFRKLADAGEGFFKSVDEFALTFDKAGKVSPAIRQKAYDLYNSRNWKDLEELFKKNDLNYLWPPANGGYNIIDDIALKVGMKFDRYGGATPGWDGNGMPPLGGNFTSPMSDVTYNFSQRALKDVRKEYDFYYEIEILKDLPFKGQTADVIPWFGQIGGGKQTMWKIPKDGQYTKTWNKLVEEGYIKIMIKDSPSGNFERLIGTEIK